MTTGAGAQPPASRRFYDAQRSRRNAQRYDRMEAEAAAKKAAEEEAKKAEREADWRALGD